MKVGIISDTHDNLPKVAAAASELKKIGVGYCLHCGDYIAPFTAAPLKRADAPFFGVFGNNDGEKEGLINAYASMGKIVQQPGFITIEGVRFALFHEPRKRWDDIDADVVCFGHTHRAVIETDQSRQIINPGEIGGWVTGETTFVVYDTSERTARLVKFE